MKEEMKMPVDANLNPIPVLGIGEARDVTDTTVTLQSTVIRLVAVTDARLWTYAAGEARQGAGELLKEGSTEYRKHIPGRIIDVTGSVNLSEL